MNAKHGVAEHSTASGDLGDTLSRRAREADELVWAFAYPHSVGTVCLEPCEQCDEPATSKRMIMTGFHCERIERTPLLIVAEATGEDWRRCLKAGGGGDDEAPPHSYFYFVRTD